MGFCPHPPELSGSKSGSAINNKDICKANHLIKNGDFLSLQPQQNSYRWRATGLGCELGSSKRATCRADRQTPSLFSARSPQRKGMASPLKVAGFLSFHSCSRLLYLLALLHLWGIIFSIIFIRLNKTAWQRTSSYFSLIFLWYFLTSLGTLALPCYFS